MPSFTVRSAKRFNIGTIVFSHYIDYLKYPLSEANIIIFADDTLLFVGFENLPSLFNKMEIALTEFVSWADSQFLTLNYSKTNYILFSRIRSVLTDLNLNVKTNIIELKPVDILDLLLMRIFHGMNMLNWLVTNLQGPLELSSVLNSVSLKKS